MYKQSYLIGEFATTVLYQIWHHISLTPTYTDRFDLRNSDEVPQTSVFINKFGKHMDYLYNHNSNIFDTTHLEISKRYRDEKKQIETPN